MPKFSEDIKKYKKYSGKSGLVLFFTQQGLWALFFYRINHTIYKSSLPKFIKKVLLFFCVLSQKWIEIVAGISLPYSAKIGHSFYIGHFGNVILHANSVIGDNCNIAQGVTVGVSGRGKKRGVPVIGNNIYIGANATIVGNIIIGNNAVIAANSLVVDDVPEGTTVLGVPAVVVNTNDSTGYI